MVTRGRRGGGQVCCCRCSLGADGRLGKRDPSEVTSAWNRCTFRLFPRRYPSQRTAPCSPLVACHPPPLAHASRTRCCEARTAHAHAQSTHSARARFCAARARARTAHAHAQHAQPQVTELDVFGIRHRLDAARRWGFNPRSRIAFNRNVNSA